MANYTTVQYRNGNISTYYIVGELKATDISAIYDVMSADIGTDVSCIGENAFANSHIAHVIIPDSVVEIKTDAFANCLSLGMYANDISLPSSLTSIGEGAFTYTHLKSITIPSSVVNIGWYAFAYCH